MPRTDQTLAPRFGPGDFSLGLHALSFGLCVSNLGSCVRSLGLCVTKFGSVAPAKCTASHTLLAELPFVRPAPACYHRAMFHAHQGAPQIFLSSFNPGLSFWRVRAIGIKP